MQPVRQHELPLHKSISSGARNFPPHLAAPLSTSAAGQRALPNGSEEAPGNKSGAPYLIFIVASPGQSAHFASPAHCAPWASGARVIT